MEKLVSIYPILYLSKQYEAGDELPTHDPKMVSAWLEAGTAIWKSEGNVERQELEEEPDENTRFESVKNVNGEVTQAIATSVTAQVGLVGETYEEAVGEKLVGKVTTIGRRKK